MKSNKLANFLKTNTPETSDEDDCLLLGLVEDGRKRALKNRSALNRKLQREIKRKESAINSTGETSGSDIRKKLLFGEVLKTQLAHNYGNEKGFKLKQLFAQAVSGKLCYATFCKLRQFWAVDPKVMERDMCLCSVHANTKFLTEVPHHYDVVEHKKPHDFFKDLCCEEESGFLPTLQPGDWVAVEYDDKVYPGVIVTTLHDGIEVNTMGPTENRRDYKWPFRKDELFYAYDKVIKNILPPVSCGSRAPQLTFVNISPMTSLVLTDSSQLTSDNFKKLPDQITYPYSEPDDLQKHDAVSNSSVELCDSESSTLSNNYDICRGQLLDFCDKTKQINVKSDPAFRYITEGYLVHKAILLVVHNLLMLDVAGAILPVNHKLPMLDLAGAILPMRVSPSVVSQLKQAAKCPFILILASNYSYLDNQSSTTRPQWEE
uniref:Uncharacterized protein n=1 Tax=Timema monikensis TaxID=170555 RepID=A0A7R9EEE7_9NEOP|nr:unnamed protein product [Timema monikensis]